MTLSHNPPFSPRPACAEETQTMLPPAAPQTDSSRQGHFLFFPKKPLNPSKSYFNQHFLPCGTPRGVMKEAQTALLLSPPINPLFGLGSFFFFLMFLLFCSPSAFPACFVSV